MVQKEGQLIYIDLGSDFGVKKLRSATFYKDKGKEIKNNKTGEVIGYERTEIAKDHVSEVMPTMCKVKLSKKDAEAVSEGDMAEFKPENWILQMF